MCNFPTLRRTVVNKFAGMYTILVPLWTKEGIGNKELVVSKKGVETVSHCGVGLVLFTEVNNTSSDDFEVEVIPDQCCLGAKDNDCEIIEVIGDCVETVPRGTTKTMKLVAQLIDPLERHGHCILYLDSRPTNRQRGTTREAVKIPFDTRVSSNKQAMDIPGNVTSCDNIDEDPLNDCNPVDCATFYNGKKSHFDIKTKRCVKTPECVSENNDDEVPNVIYDPTRNLCVVGKSVSDNDINLIKELTGEKQRQPKDILIIKNVNPIRTTDNVLFEPSTNSAVTIPSMQNITKKISQIASKDYKLEFDKSKIKNLKESGKRFFMAKYFIANRWTIMAFGGIIFVQCCLICTLIYCFGVTCTGDKQKKVVRKFFNYRQDASVTTPLICTSNIDTETTEFQYLSESSNIDKKIKCYKACQKERRNNVKMSMSDDILSKCLTRRDWSSKPQRSEAIPEVSLSEETKRDTIETLNQFNESIYRADVSNNSRKVSNVKVNFESETPKKEKRSSKIVKSIVKKIDSLHNRRETKNIEDFQCDLSEKEIKCHSYNYNEGNSNITGFKPSSHSKKLGFFRTDKSIKGTISLSTEKGAQATFSNDSIDEFLSETGLMFLAGEDLSKYSFSSRSNAAKASSLSSEVSSKTSKNNNMVKNVLSLLHKKSKHSPSSDPGVKKSSNIDLELIHMSNASVYSSNNDSDYLKNLKITKDSRSSL